MNSKAINQKVFEDFKKEENLSEQQAKQFSLYASFLKEKNEVFNLTAMRDDQDIFTYHFQDALALEKYTDFSLMQCIVDVGSGAGFPGIPLKIKYPHLQVILIEVNKKKIQFLWSVIELLSLENIEVVDLDWRTFTRKTSYKVDFFLSRASLSPIELFRIYRQGSFYNNAGIIYFGSIQWVMSAREECFFEREVVYKVGSKTRKFIFFQKR